MIDEKKLIERLEYLQKDKYVLAPTVCYVLEGVKQYVNQLAEEYKQCSKPTCKDCEVYDTEKHYCPKWCELIKRTTEELAEEYNNESVKGDLISRSATIKALEEGVFVPDWNLALAQTIVANQPTIYNDGWIPVSSGKLPEEGVDVLVWYEYFRYGNYNCLYQTYGISCTFNEKWCGLVNGSSGWKDLRIIAWQPLPASYQPKGE